MSHPASSVGGMIFHPWRELRQLTHVSVSWVDLPMGTHGRTDGSSRIEINRDLLQVERRCALTHELQHIFMGHRGHQPPAVERVVRVIVARRLIPLHALVDAYRWAGDNLHELADELWVTQAVLMDRLNHLHMGEREQLAERH